MYHVDESSPLRYNADEVEQKKKKKVKNVPKKPKVKSHSPFWRLVTPSFESHLPGNDRICSLTSSLTRQNSLFRLFAPATQTLPIEKKTTLP